MIKAFYNYLIKIISDLFVKNVENKISLFILKKGKSSFSCSKHLVILLHNYIDMRNLKICYKIKNLSNYIFYKFIYNLFIFNNIIKIFIS